MSLKTRKEPLTRISISLPRQLARELDGLVAERGFGTRSGAVNSMIREQVLEQRQKAGDTVMMGTITLFFKQTRAGLLEDLASLKRRYVDEVIGTMQVLLEGGHLMEVIVVQGPARKLERITDALVACSGVKIGKLTLTTSLIPPLHPLPSQSKPR
jgi:CopG family nickel-responsive transcriptional regulator